MWINAISDIHSASWPLSICPYSGWPSCGGENFYVGNSMQIIQPNSFIPTMLIGIIDFHSCTQLSVVLALAGVTRSAESKTCWLHFLAHFSTERDGISCDDIAVEPEQSVTVFEWDFFFFFCIPSYVSWVHHLW